MAAVDFPNSPSVGQMFVSGTRAWSWDGVSWNLMASVSPALYSIGLEADRPTGSAGMQYFATNTLRLFLHDGTGWIIQSEPEQTYTPATSGFTLGTSPIVSGVFQRSNGMCDFYAIVRLGVGGTIASSPFIGLPVNPAGEHRYKFAVQLTQSGVNDYRGAHNNAATGDRMIQIYATAGSTATGLEVSAIITSTSPFTAAQNSTYQVSGRFRMQTCICRTNS